MFDETDNSNNGADNDAPSTVVTNENDFMSIENSTLGKASNHKVLYSDLTKACNELIRFVTNDQKRSKAVFSTLIQWTRLFKEGVDVNVSFERSSLNGNIDESVPAISKMCTCLDNTASDLNSKNSDFQNARPSVVSPNHASGKSVRKKSWLEFNHRKKVRRENELKNICVSSNLKSGENGNKKVRTYGCMICHKKGHRYKFCPEISGHGIPLDLKNMSVREQLCERLSSSSISVSVRKSTDDRCIMTSVPKNVIGVIIHKLYTKEVNLIGTPATVDICNKCAECSFIQDFGRKIYCSSLFALSCILAYITRSQSNIVVTKV